MHGRSHPAQQIAGDDDLARLAVERQVEKNRGEQAEAGESRRLHDPTGSARSQHEARERHGIPGPCQTGRCDR